MGLLDALFGKNETKTSVPGYLKDAGEFVGKRGEQIANLGFAPWQGPDVAAFTPMQNAAFSGTNSAAAAYGMPTSQGNGMPPPQTFAGGVQGYSSYPMFQQQLAAMAKAQPDLFNAYSQMFPNANMGSPGRPGPIAGGPTGGGPGGGNGGGPAPAPQAPVPPNDGKIRLTAADLLSGRGSVNGGGNDRWDGPSGINARSSGPTRPQARPTGYDITQPQPQFNGLIDRIDGGGAGAGLASTLRNLPAGLLSAIFGRGI